MNDIPKPLTKAETKALEKKAAQVGKNAPKEYTGVQYGAHVEYHEGQKSGYGALLQSAHGKCANLWLFSYKVVGSKCSITSCEYILILISEIDEYLQGFKRGEETTPTAEVKDCIEEFLTSKGIGIIF
jgi:hypothetical protein